MKNLGVTMIKLIGKATAATVILTVLNAVI